MIRNAKVIYNIYIQLYGSDLWNLSHVRSTGGCTACVLFVCVCVGFGHGPKILDWFPDGLLDSSDDLNEPQLQIVVNFTCKYFI